MVRVKFLLGNYFSLIFAVELFSAPAAGTGETGTKYSVSQSFSVPMAASGLDRPYKVERNTLSAHSPFDQMLTSRLDKLYITPACFSLIDYGNIQSEKLGVVVSFDQVSSYQRETQTLHPRNSKYSQHLQLSREDREHVKMLTCPQQALKCFIEKISLLSGLCDSNSQDRKG